MGVTERKEREREQRRNAIIDAAEKVFFSRGVDNATMDEVAETAELSKGTLYLYFKNKNELLHGIVGRGLDILYNKFLAAIETEELGILKIKAIGKAYAEFFKEEPDYYTSMFHMETYEVDMDALKDNPNFAHCSLLGDRIFDLLQDIVALGIKDGSVRQDLDPEKVSLLLWGHSSGVLHLIHSKKQFIEYKFQVSPVELMDYSFKLIASYLVGGDK